LVVAHGALGMAQARVAVGATVLLLAIAALSRATGTGVGAQLRRLLRPTAAALVMAGALLALPAGPWPHPIVELATKVVAGALVYVVTAATLWHLAGRPDGGERMVLETLRRRLRRAPPAAAPGESAP
jgi:hypothetical protein